MENLLVYLVLVDLCPLPLMPKRDCKSTLLRICYVDDASQR
jgi:hypothetical protein